MRQKPIAVVLITILLGITPLNKADANPQGWWGPVIGDFTAGAIISGVYGPYYYGPLSGSDYGPSYNGGTRYYYPPVRYPKNQKQNPYYKHWTEF